MFYRHPRSPGVVQGLLLLAVVAFPGGGSTPASAAERPRIYAISGARVVIAPGRVLESATIVLRDGLIDAVAADAAVPADAVEIDGSGRWVYPGLIDATSRLGASRSAESGVGSPAPATSSIAEPRRTEVAGAAHPIEGIHPEARTRDSLTPFVEERKKDVERIRNLGFGVVLCAPADGILRGSSVAILLSDDLPVAQLILRDDVAQHAAFERRRAGQGYPTSLMGAVAAIRQTLLDARRHAEWSARYEANPLGLARPDLRSAYVALAPVLSGSQRLVFHTEQAQDTLLAHRLGREFDLDLVLQTSSYEWEMAVQIAATGRPLIVSLAFPDKPKVSDADEALDVSLDELRRYVEAASGPARLHDAGVTFALTLHGLKNTADFPRHMREIVEAGLPEDVALAALTTVPAGLLGLERVVGTLERGKIANLLVTDGPLFGDQTKIRQVFVDGVEYVTRVKDKPRGNPDAVVDPRGEWSVVIDVGNRAVQRVWTIGGEAGRYGGTAETQGGTVTFDSVEIVGNVLTIAFPAGADGPRREVTVLVEGDDFTGEMELGASAVSVSGTRTGGPRGSER